MRRKRPTLHEAVDVGKPHSPDIHLAARNGIQHFPLVAVDHQVGADLLETHVGPGLPLDANPGTANVGHRGRGIGTILRADQPITGAVVRRRQRQCTRRLGRAVHGQSHEEFALSGEERATDRASSVRRVDPNQARPEIETFRDRLTDLHVDAGLGTCSIEREWRIVRIDADAQFARRFGCALGRCRRGRDGDERQHEECVPDAHRD